MKYLFPHLLFIVDVSSLSCDVRIWAKHHLVSFPSQLYKLTRPFTLIHSDVWGPSKVNTSSQKRCFVTFIDDHTRLTQVFFITNKFEVPHVFKNFYHTVETQFNAKIAFFRVIKVVSFKTISLVSFCSSKGLFTKAHVLTLNKMGLSSRKTITFSK